MLISRWAIAVATTLAVTAASLVSGTAGAEGIEGQAYVAEFVCGEQKSNRGFIKGRYGSTVIISNANPAGAVCGNYYIIVANALRNERIAASPKILERIGPAEVLGADCEDIRSAFDPRIEGFLAGSLVLEVIPAAGEQPRTLSMTTINTAKKRTPSDAIEEKEWDTETMTVVPTTISEVDYPVGSTPTYPCP
jgi:hypothetical protein